MLCAFCVISTCHFILGRQDTANIHTLCLRIPIEHIISGNFFHMGIVPVISTMILLITAFLFGPLFCGKLCPVGALPEYLSKLVPNSLKIEWAKYLPMTALRAGFLVGFLVASVFGGYLACSYCNYYVFDLFVNYIFWGYNENLKIDGKGRIIVNWEAKIPWFNTRRYNVARAKCELFQDNKLVNVTKFNIINSNYRE